MPVAVLPSTSVALAFPAFPSSEVEATLMSELIEAVKAEALVKGVSLPAGKSAVAALPFRIDSLVVVSILCAIEPILGIEVPESVVKMGGYASVVGAVSDLLSSIKAVWGKKMGVKV